MNSKTAKEIRPIEILLVEDSPGDVRLTIEAFKEGKMMSNLHIANDGVEAMEFLREGLSNKSMRIPDLILLDLNMPRMGGREVLSEIKTDEDLKLIPVCILTTSDSEIDILESYRLYANSYITKPVDIDKFTEVAQSIEHFWLSTVQLPTTALSKKH